MGYPATPPRPSCSHAGHAAPRPANNPPELIMLTESEIEDILDGGGRWPGYFKPLRRVWDTEDARDLKKGMEVLWSSPKSGSRGGPSTTLEHFHGTFHGWDEEYPNYAMVS